MDSFLEKRIKTRTETEFDGENMPDVGAEMNGETGSGAQAEARLAAEMAERKLKRQEAVPETPSDSASISRVCFLFISCFFLVFLCLIDEKQICALIDF